jgi:hypothetical protein
MSRDSSPREAISLEELDEFLAAESGMSVEEFRRRANEIEIGPLEEAEPVEE